MSFSFFFSCTKSKVALFALAALCVCRFIELLSLAPERLAGVTAAQGYAEINSVNIASFIFVPLFCLMLVPSTKILSHNNVIVLNCSRDLLALRYLACALGLSLFYSVVLVITALPIVFLYYPVELDFLLTVLLSFFLQIVFFSFCALVFYSVFIITRLVAIAFIVVLVYGVWDFMAVSVVGGGLPFIGWSHTFVISPIVWTEIFSNGSFLLALGFFAFLVTLLFIRYMDFLETREA